MLIEWRIGIVEVVLVNVRLLQANAIDDDSLILDADNVAGNGDNALDIVLLRIERILEDDDLAAGGWAQKVTGFVNEDIFLIVQGGLHTLALDVEVLQENVDEGG